MTKRILISVAIFFILIMPVFSFAQGLVPCDNKTPATMCDFGKFMILINRVIDFIFTYMALPLAAVMFAYAGVLLVTAAGSTESRGKAKKIFTSTVIGLVLAAAAWVIVKTFLTILGYNDIGTYF